MPFVSYFWTEVNRSSTDIPNDLTNVSIFNQQPTKAKNIYAKNGRTIFCSKWTELLLGQNVVQQTSSC